MNNPGKDCTNFETVAGGWGEGIAVVTIPADSTFSHTCTLEIIVTTFGSIRVIRLFGAVIVSVIMAMGTVFHHLVRGEMFY